MKFVSFAASAVAGLCLVASPVLAQPAGVTKDEFKCESGAGNTLSKFVGAKGKCVQKCLAAARKTMGPYTDCFAPYGGATLTCITDPTKGAEAKAAAGIVKGCTKDCPECYAPSVCSSGQPFVSTTETQLDAFGLLVYCIEAASGNPTTAEAKCEDAVSKTLAKFVGSKSKCYSKCNSSIFSGKIPVGSCNPPTPSDVATQTCITTAEGKAAAGIDKSCSGASANPTCYGPPQNTATGAAWVNLAEAAVDTTTPTIACGSPSGAFLQ